CCRRWAVAHAGARPRRPHARLALRARRSPGSVLRTRSTSMRPPMPITRGIFGLCFWVSLSQAQTSTPQERLGARRVSEADSPALRRVIDIRLRDTPLEVALQEVATRAGLRLWYGRDLVEGAPRVSLAARNIAVATAFVRILSGTGLDLLVGPDAVVL